MSKCLLSITEKHTGLSNNNYKFHSVFLKTSAACNSFQLSTRCNSCVPVPGNVTNQRPPQQFRIVPRTLCHSSCNSANPCIFRTTLALRVRQHSWTTLTENRCSGLPLKGEGKIIPCTLQSRGGPEVRLTPSRLHHRTRKETELRRKMKTTTMLLYTETNRTASQSF